MTASRSAAAEICALARISKGAGVPGFDAACAELEQFLVPADVLCAVAWGRFENGRYGLLASTSSRLVAVDRGVITKSLRLREYTYDMVTRVHASSGWLWGGIEVSTVAGEIHFGMAEKQSVAEVAQSIRRLTAATHIGGLPRSVQETSGFGGRTSSTTATGGVMNVRIIPGGTPSLADELSRLATMRDEGLLTDDELTEAKRKLLFR